MLQKLNICQDILGTKITKPLFKRAVFSQASPNLTAHSERPDLYGNTHRTGHDSIPMYASVMSQVRKHKSLPPLLYSK